MMYIYIIVFYTFGVIDLSCSVDLYREISPFGTFEIYEYLCNKMKQILEQIKKTQRKKSIIDLGMGKGTGVS